jgi:hypothetical protein
MNNEQNMFDHTILPERTHRRISTGGFPQFMQLNS